MTTFCFLIAARYARLCGTMEEFFYEAFSGMTRLGPGSDQSTLQALSYMDKDRAVKILDIGCGVGTHSLLMAESMENAHIIAIDNNQEYIDQLNTDAQARGLSDKVQGVCMSMFEMNFEKESFDYIFAEGSIYIAGFSKGLADWKKLLKPQGLLICSEISWICPEPSEKAREFWSVAYPEMDFVRQKESQAVALGYDVVASFPLPKEAWTVNYYEPLQANLDKMVQKYADNSTAQEVIAMIQQEIDLYHEASDDYSYVFYILSKRK